jgi:hypothetical protein
LAAGTADGSPARLSRGKARIVKNRLPNLKVDGMFRPPVPVPTMPGTDLS